MRLFPGDQQEDEIRSPFPMNWGAPVLWIIIFFIFGGRLRGMFGAPSIGAAVGTFIAFGLPMLTGGLFGGWAYHQKTNARRFWGAFFLLGAFIGMMSQILVFALTAIFYTGTKL